MRRIGCKGFSCACCGKDLEPDEMVDVCSDCGAIFCKECSDTEALKRHDCEE